jgi:3-hydroxybutyrate dehydrogenase
MYVTRAALPFLRPGASVINISSVLGKMGVPGKGAYCAAKHGIIGWTRSVALELAPRDIRVNVVCPGWTTTDMADASVAEAAAFDGVPAAEWRARAIAAVPQKRFLDPAEVAELVAFLASPASSGITAEVYTVAGGATPF